MLACICWSRGGVGLAEPLREKIIEVLKTCYDPEIPINIVDLGLIYELNIQDGAVHIKMGLTAPGCPMGAFIADQVKQTVMGIKDVKNVDVEIVLEPRWTPDRMSPEARRAFGI